jgi:hypothetical protein
MKKYIFTIAVFLISLKSLAQVTQIVPLGTINNFQSGIYYKDIDGELNKYIGTWEGVSDNKKYTFVFQKFEQQKTTWSNGLYYYNDDLMVKFKVTDLATNTVLYNGLDAVNYEDFLITAINIPFNSLFSFIFTDTEANCYNRLKFTLKNVPNMPNQLKYCYFKYDDFWIDSCANYQDRMSIPVFLPKEVFILTKL